MAARDNVDLDRIVDYKAEYTAAVTGDVSDEAITKAVTGAGYTVTGIQ